MSSVGSKGVIIQDALGGDAATVTDSRLDVNIAGMTLDNVTVDSEFPAAATITDNFANPSTTSVMSMGMAWDGAAWDRLLIGGGTEAEALRVTIANNSTGVITVDGEVTVTGLLADSHNVTIDNAQGDAAYIRIADGTNTMPTMDAVGRAGFTKITDGTNTMPTMDDVSRAGIVTVTNPTGVFDGAVSIALNQAVDGAIVTLGTKADDKSAATNTTSITAMSVLKQISASVQILDDWDDSDYANVNLNINGTDVDGNSGTKSAQSQRVVIATDDIPIALVNTKLDHLSGDLDNQALILGTIDSDTNNIKIAVQAIEPSIYVDDTSFSLGSDKGIAIMGYYGTQTIGGNNTGILRCDAGGRLMVEIDSTTPSTNTCFQINGGAWDNVDLGAVVMAVRNDEIATLSNVDDGDYTPFQVNEEGALYVNISKITSGVVVSTRPATSANVTNTSVTVANTSTEICDASAVRVSLTIVNDSDEVIYLSIEDAAVMNSGIRLNPNGGSFSDEFGTDKVFGICASGSKNVTVCQQLI